MRGAEGRSAGLPLTLSPPQCPQKEKKTPETKGQLMNCTWGASTKQGSRTLPVDDGNAGIIKLPFEIHICWKALREERRDPPLNIGRH